MHHARRLSKLKACVPCWQAWHGPDAKSQWVGEEVSHSERPDLGAAKVVIAGVHTCLMSHCTPVLAFTVAYDIRGVPSPAFLQR